MSDRDWFVPLPADAPERVFAFPHAGAGPAQLAGLAQRLARADRPVAVWAANLPGRQARLDEPLVEDLDRLVDLLATSLARLAGGRYALFGYCGGGLLSLLVARALRDRGAPEPAALVVASSEAPDIAHRPADVSRLPSELLWHQLAAAGGVPAALAADERLRTVAEPAVRTDLSMLSGYRHQRQPPLSCPVTVCFGTRDDAPRGAFLGWRRQTTGALRLRELPGSHWLLDDACDGLADVLTEVLAFRSGS